MNRKAVESPLSYKHETALLSMCISFGICEFHYIVISSLHSVSAIECTVPTMVYIIGSKYKDAAAVIYVHSV